MKDKVQIFFITMLLGGITEYTCSLLQEKVFGTISWDYSYLPLNINGRTSLLHCTYWGIAGILYITYINPVIEKLKQKADRTSLKVVTTILAVFMIFNINISWIAADRQTERKHNVAPQNKLDLFLDKTYPDEYMNKIFANKRDVY